MTTTTMKTTIAIRPQPPRGWARRVALSAALTGTLLIGACAGLRSVSSDVSTYGDWPQGRTAGTFAFERLPSQQTRGAENDMLEASARTGLEKAGFRPAESGKEPDVLVQVGARDGPSAYQPWNDPLWWRGGFGYWRHGPWLAPRWGGAGFGYGFGATYAPPRYEREVGVLIRDRVTGKPLYEARAEGEGNLRAEGPVLDAMFQAALMDFPRVGANPRRVVVQMAPQ